MKRMLMVTTCMITLIALFSLQKSFSQLANSAWPMKGHDTRHTGQSPYRGVDTANVAWTFSDGEFTSSPAVGSDGTVYIACRNGYMYAFNPGGSLKWSYYMANDDYVGVPVLCSSPAISSDGIVYVGSRGDQATNQKSHLYAFYPNGTLKWKFEAEAYVESSPAIGSDGTVYVGSSDGNLYAINPDGALRWKLKVGYTIESSPAMNSSGTVFVVTNNILYAANKNGNILWYFDLGDYANSSPAIGSDGTLYIGIWGSNSGKPGLYAIRSNGTLKWKYETEADVESSPAIGNNGKIYVGSDDYNLYSINSDGTLNWKFRTGGYVRSSPTIDSIGIIYVGSYDGYFYAVNPDGTLKWKFQTSYEIAYSSPAISSEGNIYIGDCYNTRGEVLAFGRKDSSPPAPITDLSVLNVSSSFISITWTAPGDDANLGVATKYDIRYSPYEINDSNWSSATKVSSPPAPRIAGTYQKYSIDNLSPNTSYYIAIKAADEENNWSGLSNIFSATTIDSTADGGWNIKLVDGGVSYSVASLAVDANNKPHIVYYGNNRLYYSKYDGNSWASDTIESKISVGSISIALGNNNLPHIIYRTSNELKYAFFDGSSWRYQVVLSGVGLEHSSLFLERNGNPRFSYFDETEHTLKYAYYDGSSWHFQTIDSCGSTPSFCLDKSDNPHISYYFNKKLKYSFNDGSRWLTYIIDTSKVNSFTSIAVDDNGRPHITYTTYTETCDWYDSGICLREGPRVNDLKYAFYNGNAWSYEILEKSTGYPTTGTTLFIFMDNAKRPFVVYYKGMRECTEYVPFLGCIRTAIFMKTTQYIYKQGASWIKGTLDNSYRPGSYIMDNNGNIHYCSTSDGSVKYALHLGSSWQPTQIVRPQVRVGNYNSLALDSDDRSHLSYYNETTGNLKYAYYNGATWEITAIDTARYTGLYTGIALDNKQHPHIGYFLSTGPLKYAWFDGSLWHIEITSGVGGYGSMVLDKRGLPHISYFSLGVLIYTYYDGSAWLMDTLKWTNKIAATYSSIVLDNANHPHISFVADSKLIYAKFDGIHWQYTQIDSNLSESKTTIVLDSLINPHVSYSKTSLIKYASYDGISWQIQTVDEGSSGSLVLDGHNKPNIAYLTSNDIRYAYYDGHRWLVYTIGLNASQISFALDRAGRPHISYYDSRDGSLKYIYNPILTGVESLPTQSPNIPVAFVLSQNYPNPFNPATTIRYQLPKSVDVSLKIYNVLGQFVRTLVDEIQMSEHYMVRWNGRNEQGHDVTSGVYFYRLRAGEFVQVKKMILVR